ncbi:MAG TPA: hypothetical protein VN442_02490 [Bryobacteraceae bacterium]|nr:hypothetical protein [Bryobacteraceae bacterium]
MRALPVLAVLLVAPALLAQPAPEILPGGIVSAADNSSASLGLPRGSLISIYGRNLTSGTVRVKFSAGEVVAEAPVLFASSSQINARVPAEMPLGRTAISVVTSAGESDPLYVPMVDFRFTAFTRTGRPFGPAIVQQYRPTGITLNRLMDPASAGDALVLWGTGLGTQAREDVTIRLGMFEVKPFYAGPAPGLPGVDQINFIVPKGVTSRCFLPFNVRLGDAESAVYTVSSGAAPPCATELAITPQGLEELDRGGTVRVAALSVTAGDAGSLESAAAWVGEYDAAYLSVLANYDIQPAVGSVTCGRREYSFDRSTNPLPGRAEPALPPEIYGLRRVPGALEVSVTGPGNCNWTFSISEDGVLRAVAPFACPAQNYAMRDPSGIPSAVGVLPLPPPPQIYPSAEMNRQDGTVAWDSTAGARVTVDLSSRFTLPGNIFNGLTNVRELSCRLSGDLGGGRIAPSDIAWGLGLPSAQSARFRASYTGGVGGSWASPLGAQIVRATRVVEGPLTVR